MGGKMSRLRSIWHSMKNRCYDTTHPYYKYYGEKGITICSEWLLDFSNFKQWAESNGYADNLTIDRIDNSKGYFPSNCRWATMKEQQNNRTSNHLITYKGETKTMKQWAESLGIPYRTVKNRIVNCGYSAEKAFSIESYKNIRQVTLNNKTQSIRAWCKELGLNYNTVLWRLHKGWPVDKAFISKGGK